MRGRSPRAQLSAVPLGNPFQPHPLCPQRLQPCRVHTLFPMTSLPRCQPGLVTGAQGMVSQHTMT